MFVTELLLADASCGGKALGLARLLRAGSLSVPDGFVITNALFAAAAGAELAADVADMGHALGEAAQRIASFTIPDEVAADVARRAAALGPALVVRSSATIEDGPAGAAAGVYSSRRAVPLAELWDAVRAVWTSALTPLAAAYARRRGGTIAIAVIVQRFVEGERMTIYTRPPGRPTGGEILVQRGEQMIRLPRPENEAELRAPGTAPGVLVAVRHALRAEQIIEASGGADVEVVQESSRDQTRAMIQTWTVQARAIVHPPVNALVPPPPAVLAQLADGRTWTWDVAHNPDPLSVAQTELVDAVERAGISPYALRVCAGFLYTAPRGEQDATHAAGGAAATTTARFEASRAVTSARDLALRAAELEARLEGALVATPATWPAVLDGYLAFYAIWAGEVGALISSARRVLPAALAAANLDASLAMRWLDRPSAVEATLIAAARGALDLVDVERVLGVLSPAWDVAVPTFAERPGLLRDAIERTRAALVPLQSDAPTAASADAVGHAPSAPGAAAVRHAPSAAATTTAGKPPDSNGEASTPSPPAAGAQHASPSAAHDDLAARFAEPIAIARLAADLAERDDAYFARAQGLVRTALLARGRELGLAGDDVFWLPFTDLGDLGDRAQIDPVTAARKAAGARAAAARAARWQMPIVVPEITHAARGGAALRGTGTGPRVTGRVVRFASLASAIAVGRGDVIVARAVTPALAVMVAGCAALVSETGGLLDHGAALARELGITCIVGCTDAWSRLCDGMLVSVDGTSGTVEIDEGYSSSSP
jgi:phosphohistidine swiveling domain-containing protein